MKTRRFDFNWRPLQLQISFVVDGSVPDTQNYNSDTQEYTPDYTLTPLIIQPSISVIDKDEVIAAGRINHQLTNVRWYENVNGVSTLIATSNANYEITTSGGMAGRIKVKRNAEPKIPITLEFYAELIDSRNNQVIILRGTYQIHCSSSADLVRVELDAADQTIYNPMVDAAMQTITATVWRGASLCPKENYEVVWEVMGSDKTWRTVGSDAVMDYDVTASGDTATINRWLMGDEAHLRCRVKFSANGDPSSVSLTSASPSAEIAFRRRIPKFEYDIADVPYNIPAGLLRIVPRAVIRTTNGDVANAEAELLPLWYLATNKASGSLSYTLVGHGMNPTLSTAQMSKTYGAVIGLDVVDRGAAAALTDADGSVFVDGDGSILIIH